MAMQKERSVVYYLDYSKLHKITTKEQRVEVRRTHNRDKVMEYRLKLQHNTCFYCEASITMSDHLDHMIPVYYGGTNQPRNLVAACKACNMAKMTDQIEITNPHTINDFKRLQEAHKKWNDRLQASENKSRLKRYTPKHERLYQIYRADLFKAVHVNYSC